MTSYELENGDSQSPFINDNLVFPMLNSEYTMAIQVLLAAVSGK